jgi:hypothetical protein
MILKFTSKEHLTFRISFEKDGYNETVLLGSISTLKLFLILNHSMGLYVLHPLRITKEIGLKSMKRHYKGKRKIALDLLTLNLPMLDQCFSHTKELKLWIRKCNI